MEPFSLEEDDYRDMFITQSDSRSANAVGNVVDGAQNQRKIPILQLQYKDISDDDFDILLLQNRSSITNGNSVIGERRFVFYVSVN